MKVMTFTVDPKTHEVLLNGAKISDLASLMSLLLLIVGFFITLRTLTESIRLNKLQTLPLIHFKYVATNGGSLHIVNSGKSPAVGIKIENLYNISYAPEMLMSGLTITRFKHKNFLDAGAESLVTLESKGPWAAWGEEMNLYSMFREQKPVKYYVRYRDLSNRKYIMRVSVYNEDSDISGVPKIYGIRQKIIVFFYSVKDLFVLSFRMIRAVYIPTLATKLKKRIGE